VTRSPGISWYVVFIEVPFRAFPPFRTFYPLSHSPSFSSLALVSGDPSSRRNGNWISAPEPPYDIRVKVRDLHVRDPDFVINRRFHETGLYYL